MKNIIYTCIILHITIVEDKRDTYQNNIDYDGVTNNMSIFEISSGAHLASNQHTSIGRRRFMRSNNITNFKQIWLNIFRNVSTKKITIIILCNIFYFSLLCFFYFNAIVFNYLLLCKNIFLLLGISFYVIFIIF